jgi:hypothetical protein
MKMKVAAQNAPAETCPVQFLCLDMKEKPGVVTVSKS